ncbi:MAG TPA: hypothetical protein DD490_23520 [Acidobacteria bacterium]|nr:hypothetical protein [Acidobacteriota bacterium]
MSDGSRQTLDAWLQAAYAPDAGACPPPEAFLAAERADLSPAGQQAIDAHADRCPACAAERDLARLFDAAPAEAGVAPEDLEHVVSRLAAPTAAPARSNVVPFPGPRRPAPAAPAAPARTVSRSLLRFAAAAVLVLGFGLTWRVLQAPPDLPTPEVGGALRGATVEVVAPVGEVADLPAELRWGAVPGAAGYRVRLTTVDGSVLWEAATQTPVAPLPADLAGRLHRAVRYTWTVEALDPQGGRLAISPPVGFQAKPRPEEPPL